MDGSGLISLDALDWLAEQNIPIIRVKWNGSFFSLVSSGGLSADADKFAWQLNARECDVERLNFYLPILRRKFINSIETLEAFFEPSKPRDTALSQISKYIERLDKEPPNNIKVLLGMEAQSASVYFLTWRTLEMKWNISQKNPIPDDWRSFYSRGSLKVLNTGNSNIFATHPVNAMLNYAYTVLLGQTQLKVIADGYDPMLGIIHKRSRSQYGPPRPGFAIDMMEPERPVVDRAVLTLIQERTYSGADFDLQSDGVVRMNPELARLIGVLAATRGE